MNNISLKTFGIVIALFEIMNNQKKFRFFEKFFLLAKFYINIVLEMLFLILSNVKINFLDLEPFLRIDIPIKIISIIK